MFEITKGEHKGARLWHYVPVDPDAAGFFRMKEFVKALGLKLKGALDTDKLVGEDVQLRVKADSYNDEYKARVGSVLAAKDDDDDEDEEDLDEEAEDDEEDEDEAEDEDEDEDEDDAPDYAEMSLPDLRKAAKAAGVEVPAGLKGAKLKAALIEALEEGGEEEDEEEAEEDEADDYESWTPDQLKEELKERGLKTAGKKSILIGRLRKDDEEDDPFD